MTFEDYRREVLADAQRAMGENAGSWGSWDGAYAALFMDDAVTGNASGSYTFNASQALDNVLGLVGDAELASELACLGCSPCEAWAMGPEALDVVARCLVLGCVSGELEGAYGRICG